MLTILDHFYRLKSLKSAFKIEYSIKDCSTHKIIEAAETAAQPVCDKDKKHLTLHFKTNKSPLMVKLAVSRTYDGRKGVITEYSLKNISASPLTNLASPKVIDEANPIEKPLSFEFSGFAFIEQERTANFGYDQGTTSQTAMRNFDSSFANSTVNNTSLLSNMNFVLTKDRSQITSILEMGEVYFGNSATGGGVGARSNAVFELRDFYLTQTLNDKLSFRGGIVPLISDARGLVFNDHIGALQFIFKNDLTESTLWYGQATNNRPGASKNRDLYLNLKSDWKLAEIHNLSFFGLMRDLSNETFASATSSSVAGSSKYYWYGFDYNVELFKNFTPDITFIYNSGEFTSQDGRHNDSMSAYLADLKLKYEWAKSDLIFTFESLWTSGERNSFDSTANAEKLGKRDHFNSIVGASYLLTLTTSDGADDSVGTPKQSTLASLSQREGLNINVAAVTYNFSKRLTSTIRYGHLSAREKNSSTNSSELGQEYDFTTLYSMTPTTELQFDAAYFDPGAYYAYHKDAASLASLKLKLKF